jgi:hypothetical protein
MIATLLPLCLSLAGPQSPQGAAQVTELISLAHIVSRTGPFPPPPWGTLLRRPDADEAPDELSIEAAPGIPIEGVVDLLRKLNDSAGENNRLHLEIVGTTLLAVGEAAEVAKVKEQVQHAGPLVARSVQVELAVWDATDRETPAAVMNAGDFARWSQNATPLSRSITSTRAGRTTSLERLRWTRYVQDVDAEIAQKANATRPVLQEFGDGAHAVVSIHPLCGADEFALHVQFVAGQRRGVVRTLQTGMPGAADLEIPQLETVYGACSARIQNGGALAVTLRGHASCGGQQILTLRVTGRTPPANSIQGGLGIFPCGALTSAALTAQIPDPDHYRPREGQRDSEPTFGYVEASQLLDLVRAHAGDEETQIENSGEFVVARGSPTALAKIEAFVRGLQDRFVRNAVVRHVGSLEPTDNTPAASAPLLHEIVAPTLLGRQLTVARCLETNAITGLEVQIAQEASSLDPVVTLLQSGCWLSARLAPQDDALFLRLHALDHHAIMPQARSVMPGGVLCTPEVTRTITDQDSTVVNGQAAEHGSGPAITLDGRSYRSSLATTVRW